MPEDSASWSAVTYACETCGHRYTTQVYGGLARQELGEGRRGPVQVPTQAGACAADGGRFRLVTS